MKMQWRYYPQERSAQLTFTTELLLLRKFDYSSPSVTQGKEICYYELFVIWDYELMRSLPQVVEYPMELFYWCLSTVQIWCF